MFASRHGLFGAPWAAAAVLVSASGAAFAQPVPGLFDGSGATYQISAGSNLRVGEGLTTRIVVTLWQTTTLKGIGTCSQAACPVVYDGQNLFARRSRLKLSGPSAPQSTTGGTAQIARTLRRGDKGDDVLLLQDALNRSGASLTVDRNFGRGTRAAVETFQRARGLKVDGVAGPETLRALGV